MQINGTLILLYFKELNAYGIKWQLFLFVKVVELLYNIPFGGCGGLEKDCVMFTADVKLCGIWREQLGNNIDFTVFSTVLFIF